MPGEHFGQDFTNLDACQFIPNILSFGGFLNKL
jgi:hypothetical protein